MISKRTLKKGFTIFGGKGNVYQNTAHIYKTGYGTLCKTPALSFNYADELGMDAGCEQCCKIYKKEHQ
mgnify:FL=1